MKIDKFIQKEYKKTIMKLKMKHVGELQEEFTATAK